MGTIDFLLPYHLYLQEHRHQYLALYHAFRDAIAGGTLAYGTKLPSSRELAALYSVSRGCVSHVYEMLFAEGFVTGEVGRGTFVTFRREALPEGGVNEAAAQPRLSAWGRRLAEFPLRKADRGASFVDFADGLTDLEHFPTAEWSRCLYAEVRHLVGGQRTGTFATEGYLPLREAIALHLRRSRGIQATAEQVVVFNGSMQALALLAQLLLDPGDRAVVEDPGYPGMRQAVKAAGGEPLAAAVDEHGIVPNPWDARLLFVTPSRQFPTGVVLSLERRQQLLRWAAERGALIVEDDYDSEYRYAGRPIEPLKTLDETGRVIYVGTFSKTMRADLRIGFAVMPPSLVEPVRQAKQLYEPHPTSLIEQRALASFMNSGQYERHIRRMKRIYAKKYTFFYRLLQEKLGSLFNFIPTDAGLHIYAEWRRSPQQYESLMAECRRSGVRWTDGSIFYAEAARTAAYFGFAHLREPELAQGVERIVKAWERLSAGIE